MKIHEHQAKEILKKYGVPVPIGYVAYTVDQAVEAARKLPTEIAVVKAQIHAGGRRQARATYFGHDARHAPDRSGRPEGGAAARRAGRRYFEGVLRRHRAG